MKLLKCQKCGKIIIVLDEGSPSTICCGEDMIELVPRSIDGAIEKHVPVVDIKDNELNIKVGEVEHPMTEEHYIKFIIIETTKGYMIKKLNPNDKPEARFILAYNEEYINTYAYCNLHGLWNNK